MQSPEIDGGGITVYETLAIQSILTWLICQEDVIAFSRRERLQSDSILLLQF
jgi:hypothetical protein